MRAPKLIPALAFALASVQLSAQSTEVNISDQVARTFTLPSNGFTTAFVFDVPAGVTRLKVDLTGNATAGDVDLFLRKEQSFITRNSFNQNASFDDLAEFAQYASIGGTSAESILITPSSKFPVSAGRYYLAVFNGHNAASTSDIKVTFNPPVAATNFQVRFDLTCAASDTQCKCDPAAWNDPTTTGFPATGNTGRTLGEKRRNAMLAATQQLAQQLATEQPVVIRACFGDLGAGTETVTLAQAGPSNVIINDPSLVFRTSGGELRTTFPTKALTQNNAWMSIASAARNAGTSGCRVQGGDCSNHFDLSITFNTLVDTPQALGARSYSYGNSPNAGDIDFVSVAVHEMVHGLGYVDLISDDGKELRGRDDAFSRQLLAGAMMPPRPVSLLNDSDRLAATISTNLQWIGAETLAASPVLAQPGDTGPRMHAPNPVQQGSSVSHLESGFYFQELMAPRYSSNRNLGIAGNQLKDIGWSNLARSAPPVTGVYAGNWYDRERSGHGFDIEPAGKLNGFDRALVTSYTFDEQGLPEYFLSVGPIVDGVFLAETSNSNTFSSLGRYTYRVGAGASVDESFAGRLRIDFNRANEGAACTESTRGAEPAGSGSLSLVARDQPINWCIRELIPRDQRPALDFTGHWYAPGDSGWGIGIASAQQGARTVVLAVLYYPDSAGNPRWAFAQANDFRNGQAIDIFQRNAFCRTCTPTTPNDIRAGSMTLNLNNVEGLANQGNTVSFSVTFQGGVGGTFSRTNAQLIRLVERPRELR
jgi:hypothetical protein